MRCSLMILSVAFTLPPSESLAQPADAIEESSDASVQPYHVYAKVAVVRDELELIRTEMGRPHNRQPEIDVRNASPREVYFQALTLFRKADQLGFEQTRQRGEAPQRPEGDVQPSDVEVVVEAAMTCILRVKKRLAIPETVKPPPIDRDKTPTDVFRSIVQANRQLNLLLDRRFSPSDVYQQVTLAIDYTARLLNHFPEATELPPEPEFVRKKRPFDVYLRLVSCFQRVRRIAALSDVEVLELKVNADETGVMEVVSPSDVYDIASLLVSELQHLDRRLDRSQSPLRSFYPGRKFPSHVFQRAGMLEAQLIELESWVKKSPEWLTEQEQSAE